MSTENDQGRQYWRSLEELANSQEFQERLHREFPRFASEFPSESDAAGGRRAFLKVMGASLALAGLTACTRQPNETIVPYVRAPEEIIPGKPLFFATAVPLSGVALGVLVENHMGRPTKVEGNPDHPASLGATDVLAQASVLGLYDPDRSKTLTFTGEIRPWSAFLGALKEALTSQKASAGAGIRFLTETIVSPTLASQMQAILKEYPSAKWHQYEPASVYGAPAGARMAFGAEVNPVYRFDQADVVLSLESDFLACGPARTRYARDFISRRRVRGEAAEMNRLYVVESAPTSTGGTADHRIRMRSGEIEAFARAVASAVGVDAGGSGAGARERQAGAIARDLQKHRGNSIVIAGDGQPAAAHALAHAMNQALGNAGKTVIYTDPLDAKPVDQVESLRELARDLDSGAVELLVIISANPVYNAPADLDFKSKLVKAKLRVHLGLYNDETAELCHWHIPESHHLEAWGDARAFDGTVTILQPLIAPLYLTKSAYEFLAAFGEQAEQSGYDVVRAYWQARAPAKAADFESWWRKSVHDGVVPDTALAAKNVTAKTSVPPSTPAPAGQGMEIVFRPDPHIHDGRFANNGWLQELPRVHTKLTWDNAVLMSPKTAQKLGVEFQDVVELSYRGRSVRAPVFVMPGHADDSATVHLGFGRTRVGKVGNGTGFNAYLIRTSDAPYISSGLEIRKTGGIHYLATTQQHFMLEGRNAVREGTLEEYKKNPEFARERSEEPPRSLTLYPDNHPYTGYAWGMVIDQTACVGCNACVVACQAENNIPVVGKQQILAGREMHWLRIEDYYKGDYNDPRMYYQPLACTHCEYAPCEVVCPVAATTHSSEGLNDMVYNRCVGTRYCSNNCPYKVRRFNFFLYSDWNTQTFAMQKNPDVTVRSRGVMEKCTYCVQRINRAKIESEKEDRFVRDGEIVTACEAACPTQAIVFGNINDKESRVSKLKTEKLSYSLLGELNTRPRTTHLAELRNPNPELEAS